VIAYVDASALVKRYLSERGSRETIELTSQADLTATSIISRAEVAAGLAKAVRARVVTDDVAKRAQRLFAGDWLDLLRMSVTEALVERAEALAWEYGLRGYDAVQLASALTSQVSAGEEIVLATFDQQLWETAKRTGLKPWPEQLPGAVRSRFSVASSSLVQSR
jgi:predicted nucleic acid-binding protein